MTTRRLVGRERELVALEEALAAAERGHGQIVLVSGEAGIGKSRFATEVADLARERGFAVLEGRAYPLYAGLAYAPVVEALLAHLTVRPEPEVEEIFAGLPDLGRLIPHPALPIPMPVGDPELETTRMFIAVSRLVERLLQRQPMMLFVDDLHWADRGTVELVHYLARSTATKRLLVLGTYRDGALSDGLRLLVTYARRTDPRCEVRLPPLTAAEVTQLVDVVLGHRPSAELGHAINQRAKGVPLFATTLAETHVGRAAVSPGLPVVIRE
ncbi:ATP-binding protein [Fodinicola feengrottensis]|uniref:Orc1-like AAA ATPase domain-containing protein n=1 Tax=Fodinicola feengrottensis TaxID=435914 RepID=A0ABN2GL86_9ACTN|nr:BREX system ATP-binding domain-containing protein [Fodinicola feengrottensis]